MTKIFFFDLDGTLRESKSGKTFINEPDDQMPIAGASKAIAHYSDSFICIGITNQGGVAAGHKSLGSAIEEQHITLNLFPELSEIFFCPNWGESCYQISRGNVLLLFEAPIGGDGLKVSCRKPGHGMLLIASQTFGLDNAWMTGDRPEDEKCATVADINFIPAEVMLAKFTPGMSEIACTHTDPNVLLKFLAL
jgi:D-glycero-D-manno-heptose 1,7-bisphosphate phosphatase